MRTSEKEDNPAVVLDLDLNGLCHARGLARRGIRVTGIYSSKKETGRLSRYCRAVRFPVTDDRNVYTEKLIEIGKEYSEKPVLYCASDDMVDLVASRRDMLEEYFLFNLPKKKQLDLLMNKSSVAKLAVEAGLDVPRTFVPATEREMEEMSGKIVFPCVIKTLDSFSTGLSLDVIRINDEEKFVSFFNDRPEYIGKTACQELVPGDDGDIFQCTAYSDSNGRVVAMFSMRKIRQYVPDLGSTSFGVSMDLPEVKALAVKLLEHLGMKGFSSVEFRKDPTTGIYYFIEVNPRLPLYCSLFPVSGMDLAYICYSDLTGKGLADVDVPAQRDGIYWICLMKDLSSFLLKRPENKTAGLFRWIRTAAKARSFGCWDMLDPVPFIYTVMSTVAGKIIRGVNGR